MTTDPMTLVNIAGVMALLGVTYGVMLRNPQRPPLGALIVGLVFGAGSIAAMRQSIDLGNGSTLDASALIIGFAGAFLGPIGAITALCLAVVARIGAGLDGAYADTLVMTVAAMAGLVWAGLSTSRAKVGTPALLALAAVLACEPVLRGMLPVWAEATTFAGLPLALFNFCGTVVFGLFIQRERRNAGSENSQRLQAITDPLTGLLNRRGFKAAQCRSEREAGRQGVAVVAMDLDHFKRVNDQYGHEAGDDVLAAFAATLRATLRKGDVAARMGGEEFAVLLPRTSRVAAEALAERIREQVENLVVVTGGQRIVVTASIGVHWSDTPARSGGLTEMLRLADRALYAAKRNGRNRVELSAHLMAA